MHAAAPDSLPAWFRVIFLATSCFGLGTLRGAKAMPLHVSSLMCVLSMCHHTFRFFAVANKQ
jgi:hypothetical protein